MRGTHPTLTTKASRLKWIPRRWTQAADYTQKALGLQIGLNDRYGQAHTYRNLGWFAEEQRRWAQALDYYLKALPVFREFGTGSV